MTAAMSRLETIPIGPPVIGDDQMGGLVLDHQRCGSDEAAALLDADNLTARNLARRMAADAGRNGAHEIHRGDPPPLQLVA